MFWKIANKIFNGLASLELAVINIIILAIALAAGTIYESKYGAAVASQVVYRSWWMQVLLWLFILNLSASAMSRLPWKRHHIGFLITHLGIIVLLLGSWIQQRHGIDGIVALAPGETSKQVRIEENVLYIFRALPQSNYELVLDKPLHFDLRSKFEKTLELSLESPTTKEALPEAKILRYYPIAERVVRAEDVAVGKGASAIKLRLEGSRANFSDWMFLQELKGTNREIGPARIRFQKNKPTKEEGMDKPTLFIYPKNQKDLGIVVTNKDGRQTDMGTVVLGKLRPLGWMDFGLVVEDYRPSAIPVADYYSVEKAPPGAQPLEALELELGQEKVWLELGASAQVSSGDSLYYIQFTKKRVDLGFDLKLNRFDIGYYPGTNKAKTYTSQVSVLDKTHLISMNEPLHYNGFTFYQASYETDEEGKPIVSVLSVNYDPGRVIKYFGSLMIVFGIISMFYFKPVYSGRSKIFMKKDKGENHA